MARALIQAGADIEKGLQHKPWVTPLVQVVMKGNGSSSSAEIVQMLLGESQGSGAVEKALGAGLGAYGLSLGG